ncbi:MAG: hypothetical protein ABH952_08805 [Candidatus Omnitrophota bacterium]
MKINNKKDILLVENIVTTLIGFFCLMYSIFISNFAELHIKLAFLNFPIFIGEILLIFCIILLGLKRKNYIARFDFFHYCIFALVGFILIKALFGYVKWGPLALRHAALFYYFSFIVIAYYFYNNSLLETPILQFLVLSLLAVSLIFRLLHCYFVYIFLLLFIALILLLKNKSLKYILSFIFLLIFPYKSLYQVTRGVLIAEMISFIFLSVLLFFILQKKVQNRKYKFFYSMLLLICGFCVIAFFTFKTSAKSLLAINLILNEYRQYTRMCYEKKAAFKPIPGCAIQVFEKNSDMMQAAQVDDQANVAIVPERQALQKPVKEEVQLFIKTEIETNEEEIQQLKAQLTKEIKILPHPIDKDKDKITKAVPKLSKEVLDRERPERQLLASSNVENLVEPEKEAEQRLEHVTGTTVIITHADKAAITKPAPTKEKSEIKLIARVEIESPIKSKKEAEQKTEPVTNKAVIITPEHKAAIIKPVPEPIIEVPAKEESETKLLADAKTENLVKPKKEAEPKPEPKPVPIAKETVTTTPEDKPVITTPVPEPIKNVPVKEKPAIEQLLARAETKPLNSTLIAPELTFPEKIMSNVMDTDMKSIMLQDEILEDKIKNKEQEIKVLKNLYAKLVTTPEKILEKLPWKMPGEISGKILEENVQVKAKDEGVMLSPEEYLNINHPDLPVQEQIEEKEKPESPTYRNIVWRMFVWQDMFCEIISKRPFIGVDFGKPFRSISAEILVWDTGLGRVGWLEPHNSYLHIIYRAGVAGGIFIIVLWGVFIRLVISVFKKRDIIGILLSTILFFWLVVANFEVIYELPYFAIPFCSLFGVALKHNKLHN